MSAVSTGLRALLGETGAYREGHFALPDGSHVLSYYNCERLFQYPALASRAADYLVAQLDDLEVNFVFSPSVSSLMLAFEVARRNDWQFVLHALPFNSPKYRFPDDSRILVVEDVVVGGKSLQHARHWCGRRSGDVVAQAVLIDRRPEGDSRFDGLPVHSAVRDPARVFSPSECPACRDGVTITRMEPNYPARIG